MRAQDFIYQSILRCPSIFPTKWHVLEHAFLVNGNGYEWENGQLVSVYGDDNSLLTEEEAIENVYKFYDDFYKCNPNLKQRNNSPRIQHDINIIKKAKELSKEKHCSCNIVEELTRELMKGFFEGIILTLYPICQYSKLVDAPDDIQDDWKELIKEFYREVLKPSIEAGIYSMTDNISGETYLLPDWIED